MNIFAKIGRVFFEFILLFGRLGTFAFHVIKMLFIPPFYFKPFFRQLLEIGFYSIPVIGLTAIFTGAVLALQSYTGFSRFHAESGIASVVVLSITRELGPVLAALMISGRVGASIAAEIGTMKVTEQIDALYALNTHPMKYLVIPRILAATLVLPVLVLIADVIGVFGGYLVSIYKLGFSPQPYLYSTFHYLHLEDINIGLIKALAFGFTIALVSCYNGFNSSKGAQGVGIATTNSVVSASILTFLLDYIITGLFFG